VYKHTVCVHAHTHTRTDAHIIDLRGVEADNEAEETDVVSHGVDTVDQQDRIPSEFRV
jgi:hypothetical protein